MHEHRLKNHYRSKTTQWNWHETNQSAYWLAIDPWWYALCSWLIRFLMMHCVNLFLCHIKKLMIHSLYHIIATHCTSFSIDLSCAVSKFALNHPPSFIRHLGWDKIRSQIIVWRTWRNLSFSTLLQSNCCFSFCTKTLTVLVLNCVTFLYAMNHLHCAIFLLLFAYLLLFQIGASSDCSRVKLCRMNKMQWSHNLINIYLLVALSKPFCWEYCCFFSWFLWFLSFPLVIFCFTFWLNFTLRFCLVSSTDVTSPSKAQPLPLMQFPTGKFSVLAVFATLVCLLSPPL